MPRPLSMSWLDKWRTLEIVSKNLSELGNWDLGIALPNSVSSAWVLFRSHAKVRRGYNDEGRGLLLNQSEPWEVGNKKHRVQSFDK
jgi:ADP-heptose:LPS heptosyltransferase